MMPAQAFAGATEGLSVGRISSVAGCCGVLLITEQPKRAAPPDQCPIPVARRAPA